MRDVKKGVKRDEGGEEGSQRKKVVLLKLQLRKPRAARRRPVALIMGGGAWARWRPPTATNPLLVKPTWRS
jgi:hypothetical protein